LKQRPNPNDQVPPIPSAPRLIRIDSARHAKQPRNMHKVEGQMESNDEQPEVPLPQRLAQHPPRHLRIPVVEGAKERSNDRTNQNIVKVSNHKVRAAQLPVERSRRKHDARQSRDKKLKQEGNAEHHRNFENNLSAPQDRKSVV